MTTRERPNRDALSDALDIYRDAMRPFVIRCLRRIPGRQVEETIAAALNPQQVKQFRRNLQRTRSVEDAIDINDFPLLVTQNWFKAFSQEFENDRTAHGLLWVIARARNRVAHPEGQDMDAEYVRSRLFDVADMLGRINQPELKEKVESIRDRLFSAAGKEPTGRPNPFLVELKDDTTGTAGIRSGQNLKPWRDAVTPSADISAGTFQEAEFAADLQQVYDGRANATDYGNPVGFFHQTYITPGLRRLLVNTLKRLGGNGGDPIIQTKTGFGGGKTHSLIALYHLVKNAGALTNPTAEPESRRTAHEIQDIMQEAGVDPGRDISAPVAVLDGTYLSPTDADKTDNGDPLHTLWGVMAYQLGGQEAYEVIGTAARRRTAPGGAQLDRLLAHVGPCVILMDELVAYVRNAGDTTDSIYTFMQALTQAVRRSDHAALVVTLPESTVEAGGTGGAEALNRLDSLLGRIEAIWQPLEVNETFEVVRRRLFGSTIDSAERDRTCEAFSRMYSRLRREFPREAGEQRYLERMKECYPIHPEVFDRLYRDWSSTPRFQRTRGVLRMMANWISRLCMDNDRSPLILPAHLRLDDSALANEFISLLPGRWEPVLSEVDGNDSRTDRIDRIYPQRFEAVGGAARRCARTVFLGSARTGAVAGIDVRRIHLGTVQPGQGTAVYDEALRRMSSDLYYLYHSENRYFFHAEENLNKVATDRAGGMSKRDVEAQIIAELTEAQRMFRRRTDIIVCPTCSGAVDDRDVVRLVILPPDKSLSSRASEEDQAEAAAMDILLHHGEGNPRHRKNTLLFLAAKSDEVRNIRSSVRTYLAWDSIVNGERRIEHLEGERRAQARGSLSRAETSMHTALVRGYRWALAPVQEDPRSADYRMSVFQTNAAETGEVAASAFQRFVEEEALVDEISPRALANMLDCYVWNNSQYSAHIAVDTLWDMVSGNVYMHRLRDKSVLVRCVTTGAAQGVFGYADLIADDGSYSRLHYGKDSESGEDSTGELRGLIVHPKIAERERIIVDEISPRALANMLDCYVWNNSQHSAHIAVGTLWDMMSDNVDMHRMYRLRDKSVLVRCVTAGAEQRAFGYADRVADDGSYSGLRYGKAPASGEGSTGELRGLIVHPKTAEGIIVPPTRTDRIVVKKTMQGEISLDDTSDLNSEIIRDLCSDGGEITVEIVIHAHKPDGFSENTIRAVRENGSRLELDVKRSEQG